MNKVVSDLQMMSRRLNDLRAQIKLMGWEETESAHRCEEADESLSLAVEMIRQAADWLAEQ